MTTIRLSRTLARSASVMAMATGLLMPSWAQAQQTGSADAVAANDEIVVTGLRASLDRSIDIKRNSNGVVDAISAVDIGKFPDTNVAESLQRIPGVSIDRVNGEGSEVTVRGFGGGYNLVTLNGRAMPTANVASVGGDQGADFATGTSRSFDFANLAAEGVKTLEVYKTARAAAPSGGIGAAINIATRRPLDTQGFTGSLGAKALYDLSTNEGAKVTPELSGVANWSNEAGNFGIGLFGSYQKRNNSTVSADSNDWNVEKLSSFLDPANGRVNASTVITNKPTTDQLVSYPNDSRYHYSDFTRERINGQLTLQFKPMDDLTLTADATYYQNRATEKRSDQTIWFNRPFSAVTFDSNPIVATTVFLKDTISGTKDGGFEQQYRAQKDKLESYGLNAEWQATDTLKITVDGHISTASSTPDNPLGKTSSTFSMAQKAVAGQTLDMRNGFPIQTITFNDNPATGGNGNNNGKLDLPDLGTQVARSIASSQRQRIKEIRADGAWDLGEGARFDFGADYRTSTMNQNSVSTYQTLGDWGVSNVGDVAKYASDLVTPFCLTCEFKHFDPGSTGQSLVAFRGDATQLITAFNKVYPAASINGQADNQVKESIWSAYGQVTLKGELAGRTATFVAGVRYEKTSVTSTSLITVPSALVWQSDNDFLQVVSATVQPVTGKNSYDNVLPAMDFSVEVTDNLIARASFGKTLARPDFGNLFANATVDNLNRPTAVGGIPSGTSGNPQLQPLVSDNLDFSVEWYYARSSFISAGFFEKRVTNFVGTGQTSRNLFGLRDPASGAPGTRSGDAKTALSSLNADPTDVNLFTMTALIDNMGIAAAKTLFSNNFSGGNLNQAFIDQIIKSYDVTANSTDPLFNFQVKQPVNNKQGKIHGFEIAGQHFFGDSGFGVAGAYTKVVGDIGIDIGADPNSDQFALLGLSDTANGTLIYDKYGLSARLAYNWRGKFLSATNRGNYRNPVFVAPYGQLDFNISYDITPHIAVSLEGINITKSSTRTYGRDETNLWFAQEQNSRFLLGARYRF